MKKTFLFVFVVHLILVPCFSQQWTSLNSGTTSHLRDIWFANVTTGWAAGDDSTLIKTTDGGNTWQALPFPGVDHNPSNAGNIQAISFLNTQEGFLAYQFNNAPVRTTDGGQSWSPMVIANASICNARGVQFFSPFNGALWGRGCFGGAYISFYGGFGWNVPELIYYGPLQSGVAGFSLDSNSGKMYAAIGEGVLVTSTSLFSTFDTLRVTDSTLWDVEWVEGGTVYLLRSDLFEPVLVSYDSGASFAPDSTYWASFAYPTLKDIDFSGPLSGFMAGAGFSDLQGVLFHRESGGWNMTMTDKPMNKVFAVQPGLAFAVGDSGQIYKFTDPLVSVPSEPQTEQGIRIFPNPSGNDNVNFILKNWIGEESLCIFDLSGQKVYETPVTGEFITINPEKASLSKGCYIVKTRNYPRGVKWILK